MVHHGERRLENDQGQFPPPEPKKTESQARSEEELFLSERVVDDWNTVPTVIKDTRSVTSFKKLSGAHRNSVGNAA